MAVAKIEIINFALGRLGKKPLVSLDEDNDRRVAADLAYEPIRKTVLADFPWGFAGKRASLGSLAPPLFGFTKAFQIPGDFISAREIDDTDLDTEWAIEGSSLVCDLGSVSLFYTYDVTDPNQFSPMFVDAFAARLAAEMAVPLTGRVDLAEFQVAQYKELLQTAKVRDSQQGSSPRATSSDIERARFA